MQDNLEFLQWTKRYWDQYYPGGEYDALTRRKGAGAAPPAAAPAARTSNVGAARRGTTPTTTARPGGAKASTGASAVLANENNQLKETVGGLERERDFYFAKLRDIEMLVQNAVEEDPTREEDPDGIYKSIMRILYSTEVSLDGFLLLQYLTLSGLGGFRDTCRGRRSGR